MSESMSAQTEMQTLTASNVKELKDGLVSFEVLGKKVALGDGIFHLTPRGALPGG